jgi:hypothetical protein
MVNARRSVRIKEQIKPITTKPKNVKTYTKPKNVKTYTKPKNVTDYTIPKNVTTLGKRKLSYEQQQNREGFVKGAEDLLNFAETIIVNPTNLTKRRFAKSVDQGQIKNEELTKVLHKFQMMDSIHDIYDRPSDNFHKRIYKAITNEDGKGHEDWFAENIFNYKIIYGDQRFYDINGKSHEPVSTFKLWLTIYLNGKQNKQTAKGLTELKETWKNKIFKYASTCCYTISQMKYSSDELPQLKNARNGIITKKLFSSLVTSYDLLLALDTMKTSGDLNTKQNKVTFINTPTSTSHTKLLKSNAGDSFICNMAQIIDPNPTNIKSSHKYRLAFPELSELSFNQTDTINLKEYGFIQPKNKNIKFFLLGNSSSIQLTCTFKIILEIHCNENQPEFTIVKKVFDEILKHAKKPIGQGYDLLTNNRISPNDLFRFARLYVLPKIHDRQYSRYVSVKGLCIDTQLGDSLTQTRNNNTIKFVTPRKLKPRLPPLRGLSINECVCFAEDDMKRQIQLKKQKQNKIWILNYYLDWKRMGDAFQITHLSDLIQLNNTKIKKMTHTNWKEYHPYHFISNDILAIVQAILYRIEFVYQKDGNGFVIGATTNNTNLQKYKNVKKTNIKEQIKIFNATQALKNMMRSRPRRLLVPKQGHVGLTETSSKRLKQTNKQTKVMNPIPTSSSGTSYYTSPSQLNTSRSAPSCI